MGFLQHPSEECPFKKQTKTRIAPTKWLLFCGLSLNTKRGLPPKNRPKHISTGVLHPPACLAPRPSKAMDARGSLFSAGRVTNGAPTEREENQNTLDKQSGDTGAGPDMGFPDCPGSLLLGFPELWKIRSWFPDSLPQTPSYGKSDPNRPGFLQSSVASPTVTQEPRARKWKPLPGAQARDVLYSKSQQSTRLETHLPKGPGMLVIAC